MISIIFVLGAWNVEKAKMDYGGSAYGYVKIPMLYNRGVGLFAVNAGGLPYDLYYMSSRLSSDGDHSTGRVPIIKRLAGDSAKGGTVAFWYSPSEQSLYYTQQYGGATAIMVYLLQTSVISVVSSIPSDNIAVSYTT